MIHEINIERLGEILCSKARSANRETIKFYGEKSAPFTCRTRFISQLQLVRDLGIPVELHTNEENGKELYTAIKLGSTEYMV